MTDKIDTSTLGRIDLASGKSAPAPIEECVSSWSVDEVEALAKEFEKVDGYRGDIHRTLARIALTRYQR